jgi:hypothetical protein
MGDPGAGLGQAGDFTGVHVDAVDSDRLRAQDPGIPQAVDDPFAAPTEAIVLVGGVLGDVDVEAQAQVPRRGDAIRQRLIG